MALAHPHLATFREHLPRTATLPLHLRSIEGGLEGSSRFDIETEIIRNMQEEDGDTLRGIIGARDTIDFMRKRPVEWMGRV